MTDLICAPMRSRLLHLTVIWYNRYTKMSVTPDDDTVTVVT